MSNSSVPANYAVSAFGDNFVPNVSGSNATGEEVVEPFSVVNPNSPSNPVIATIAKERITLGTPAAPVSIRGPTGLGLVYDNVNNVPGPSTSSYDIIDTNNLLVGVPNVIPVGTYIITTSINYIGAGKVLPANSLIELQLVNAGTPVTIAGFIVPGAIADRFSQQVTFISPIEAGTTFQLVSTGGINLGAQGYLISSAVAFCGALPEALAGSVQRSRRAI